MTARATGPATGQVAGIALLAFAWLAMLAWARPLMLPDEGRYVGVAWEMLRSGDWVVPTLDGLPYFHKPPLFYWITAAAMSALGTGEWATRVAPLLGAWLGAMSVFLLARRWWDERSARIALGVLLVQPLFFIGGQFANLDMLVAGCITATVALLAHATLLAESGRPHRAALLGAYAAAALGVLAKGLIGVVLPGAVVVAWLVAGRRWRSLWRLLSVPGALVCLAIAAPWFLAVQQRFDGFFDYFFVVQHFRRFAETGFNNVQPFWFYPAVVVLFTLPWLPWLRPQLARGRLADPARGDLRLLAWLWAGTVVLFFSIPKSKLLGYVLPAVPPLALLIADGLASWQAASPRGARWWRLSAAVTVVLSMTAVAVLAVRAPRSTKDVALALRALRGPQEPVLMLANYYFDLPLYARLDRPVPVVLDWDDPGLRRHDTWRKELADAGDFAPPADRAVLMAPAALDAALCAAPVTWVVGPRDAPSRFAVLVAAEARKRGRTAMLWRLDREAARLSGALACPGTPSGG